MYSKNVIIVEWEIWIYRLCWRANSRQRGDHTAGWDGDPNILWRTWYNFLGKSKDVNALCLILIAGWNDLLFCQLGEDHRLSYDTDLNNFIAGELELGNGHRITRHEIAVQDSED